MKIAIDASRAFLDKKTGIEEYTYQIVKSLRKDLKDYEVVLYLRRGGKKKLEKAFSIPAKWEAKEIPFKYFWTQIGMAWEFLTNLPDVLFIPAHTVPWIHPKNSVVTIHGLEYEHCPESYSLYSRWFHQFFIQKSCRWAKKVISISRNTKKDLREIYQVPSEKIEIVYNGFTNIFENQKEGRSPKYSFLFFISRIEKRKNVEGIIKAFEILKKDYKYSGKLILAGKPGHDFSKIKALADISEFSKDIIFKGYISDADRLALMRNADLFMFPSLCEGFGFPIVEAQSVKTPVVTSDIGPMNEVANDKGMLADPNDYYDIAKVSAKILQDKD
ncbi:MAG: glycosyltransferase family 4 protein, partial [Candidatus Moranbacteria bacterium]|nr:glycosyltransferase family 4 protein [Candidatus Moranbacteria bacterium]